VAASVDRVKLCVDRDGVRHFRRKLPLPALPRLAVDGQHDAGVGPVEVARGGPVEEDVRVDVVLDGLVELVDSRLWEALLVVLLNDFKPGRESEVFQSKLFLV